MFDFSSRFKLTFKTIDSTNDGKNLMVKENWQR